MKSNRRENTQKKGATQLVCVVLAFALVACADGRESSVPNGSLPVGESPPPEPIAHGTRPTNQAPIAVAHNRLRMKCVSMQAITGGHEESIARPTVYLCFNEPSKQLIAEVEFEQSSEWTPILENVISQVMLVNSQGWPMLPPLTDRPPGVMSSHILGTLHTAASESMVVIDDPEAVSSTDHNSVERSARNCTLLARVKIARVFENPQSFGELTASGSPDGWTRLPTTPIAVGVYRLSMTIGFEVLHNGRSFSALFQATDVPITLVDR